MNTTTNAAQYYGYDVIDNAGNRLGTVDGIWVDDATNDLEFIGVKTGWLMGKTHLIPTADAQFGDGAITVPYSSDQIKGAPNFGTSDELSPDDEDEIYSYYGLHRSTAPSPTGLATGQETEAEYRQSGTHGAIDATDTENINVPVHEEELQVGKREVEAGRVRLRKVVHTEHEEVPVELKREEVIVERVPASGEAVGEDAFQEGEIEVPVMREEPVTVKEAHVTGQVQLNKNVTSERQTVGDEVRREDVEVVDDTGTVTDTADARVTRPSIDGG